MTAHRLLMALFAVILAASAACSCDDGEDQVLGDGGEGGGGMGGLPSIGEGGGGGISNTEAECGNDRREVGEACDGEDLGGKRCTDFGFNRGLLTCNDDCTFHMESCWNSEICDNGIDDDDNGLIDCDDPACDGANGCPKCGDGILDHPHEQCDGDIVPVSCQARGYPLGEARCTDECRFDFSDCRYTEHCDNGIDDDGDGRIDCEDPDCHLAWECSTCGDGRLGKGEDCEATIIPRGCRDFGFDIGRMACRNCQYDMSDCRQSVCGDGVREGAEACDDGNDVDGDGCDSQCNIEGDTCDAPVNLNTLWSDADGRWQWGERTTSLWESDTYRSCAPVANQPDAIAHFTAPSGGDYEVRLEAAFDGVVWAWSGECSMHANAPLDCAEAVGMDRDRSLALRLEADETIWIAVSGRSGGSPTYGEFTLSVREFFCGDGVEDAVEVCDDGNANENDGCTTACKPSGDTCATAQDLNLLPAGAEAWRWWYNFDHFGDAMKPSCAKYTAVDAFARFQAPKAGRYQFRATAIGADGLLSIRDAVCTTVFSELACVDEHANPSTEIHERDLAAGEIVYLMIESPIGGHFRLDVQHLHCGNGVIDAPSEECDDGNNENNDGCSATCRIERCGDGLLQDHEECDDHNAIDGDGCSSECLLEGPTEVEPNDQAQDATPIPLPPAAFTFGSGRGAITPAGDVDWWRIDTHFPTVVDVETLMPAPQNCGNLPEHDTYLRVYDDMGVLVAENDDWNGRCSRVRFGASTAATYYIQVSAPNAPVVPGYVLLIRP